MNWHKLTTDEQHDVAISSNLDELLDTDPLLLLHIAEWFQGQWWLEH
jgi:hypothetical protein